MSVYANAHLKRQLPNLNRPIRSYLCLIRFGAGRTVPSDQIAIRPGDPFKNQRIIYAQWMTGPLGQFVKQTLTGQEQSH